MFHKVGSVFLLLTCLAFHVAAQELNCKVKVLHEKITGVDAQVFTSMERSITEFLNTRKWTGDEFKTTERIDCNMLFNVTGHSDSDPDLYTATLSIQATRPVYNTSYNSPTLNTIDKDVVFHYSQYTPLSFDDNRVSGSDPLSSNLTAILAYYSYLILGLDYDSFSPSGGTNLLKRAQNIVSNAPEDAGIKGWKAFEDRRNRYWIIDQLLSPRYTAYRALWYSYHREGLDQLYSKPAEGRRKMLEALNGLQSLFRDNPQSSLIQSFFNAKSDEVTKLVMQGSHEERKQYLTLLAQVDPDNAQKYRALQE
ncbi:MAG: DUF4835 family protein [Bacteroidetes bacterium]|nr:DUF4835 family protein [Bacteroidota bacterium]MBS1630620.1 DUF4835 family protein [Bacteroidota bacterium]